MRLEARFDGVPRALMADVGQDAVYVVPGSVSFADGVLSWECQTAAPGAVVDAVGMRRDDEGRLTVDPSRALGAEVLSVMALGALRQPPYLVRWRSIRVVVEGRGGAPAVLVRWDGACPVDDDRLLLAMTGRDLSG